jgi:hypothetical protein
MEQIKLNFTNFSISSMSSFFRFFFKRNLLILSALWLTACVNLPNTAPSNPTLVSFTTDGCSLFPNGTFANPNVWCHCCVAHDKVYWRGGTLEERRAADVALKECVAKSGHAFIANVMWLGVSVAGSPKLSTTFRWSYGWNYLRPYQALTKDEDVIAKVKMADYENNPEKVNVKNDK